MIIGIIASILLAASTFLLSLSLYPLILEYVNKQTEIRISQLSREIESKKDRSSIRRFATLSPWLSIAILILLLLFARSTLAVLISFVAAYFAFRGPVMLKEKLKRSQDAKLVSQLPDVLNAVANSVKAGETLPLAFKVIASKYDPPVSTVFRVIATRHDAGERFDDALLRIAADLKIDAFDFLARAMAIHVKQGGPAFDMLCEIRTAVVEQDRCERVIKATTAGGEFTMRFLKYSPLFLVPALWFLQPDWANLLLGNFFGVLLTLVASGIYLFAIQWSRSVLKFEKI